MSGAVYVPSQTRDLVHDGVPLDTTLREGTLVAGGPLKRFRAALAQAGTREVVIRQIGTSIASFTESPGKYLAEALQRQYGKSASQYLPAAEQAGQAISGWQAQYYGGPFTVRLRGRSGDGATAITKQVRAASLTLYYGRESDGGNVGVTVNGVSQSAINCNGAQSIHNAVTYTLDPSTTSTIVITPPSSGYGYLEAYFWAAPTVYVTTGIRFDNLAYGGSGLKHEFSGSERPADVTMATSQAISGTNGVSANFAPISSYVKPDLILVSGPTNDLNGGSSAGTIATYKSQLATALALADAAGIDVAYVMEPANGQCYSAGAGGSSAAGVTSTGTAPASNSWIQGRAAILSALLALPDASVFIDWDFALKPGAFADRFHNQSSLSDPHPADAGWGDPYLIGGSLLCARLGVPMPSRTAPTIDAQRRFATILTQSTEPLFAPVGSLWEDTSNGSGAGAVLKRRVASLADVMDGSERNPAGARGVWELVDGSPGAGGAPVVGDSDAVMQGSWGTVGTLFPGEPSAHVSGANQRFRLVRSAFVPGHWYTLSLTVQGNTVGAPLVLSVMLGASNTNSFLNPLTGQFNTAVVQSGEVSVLGGDNLLPRRYVLTFQFPTTEQLTTISGLGVDSAQISIGLTAADASTATISQLRVDPGASLLLNKNTTAYHGLLPSLALNTVAIAQATEPDTTLGGWIPGGLWRDTSNGTGGSSVLKRLVGIGGITPATAVNTAGTSLWQAISGGGANLLAGASLSIPYGSGVKDDLTGAGPGIQVPGWRLTNPTAGSGATALTFASPINTNLTAGAWHTLSFLFYWDFASGTTSGPAPVLYVELDAINAGNNNKVSLKTDQATWQSSGVLIDLTGVPARGTWQRLSLKFQAYTSDQQPSSSDVLQTFTLRVNSPGYTATIADLRLETGISVTMDN